LKKRLKNETYYMYIVRMVRASKTTDAKQSATPAVKETATKAPRVKKTKSVTEVAAVEVAAPVVDSQVSEVADVELSVATKMTEFGAKLQQIFGFLSTVKVDFKTLEKVVNRELKSAKKASSKKRRTNGNRQPSGFVKPTRISDELAEFLGKTVGTEMARTVVSKEINSYIRANKLQDPANGRKINPDLKLSKLLKINKGEELTYFNLQKYMKHHFIKQVPVATA
jgi:chromatin remodeling complex protein RSC6